ncbi:MAG: hypothetical protein IKW20_02840, partial [Bacteroidales bacterium]|nr:hypothetical protein [Bacteroidales bacterium]
MSIGEEYMSLLKKKNQEEEEKKKKEAEEKKRQEKREAYEKSSDVGKEYMRLRAQKQQKEYDSLLKSPAGTSMDIGPRAQFDLANNPIAEFRKENREYFEYLNALNYDVDAGQKKIDDLKKAIDLQDEIDQDQGILDNWMSHWEDQEIPQDVQAEMDLFRDDINSRIKTLRSYGVPEGMSAEEYLESVRADHHQKKMTKKELEMSSVVNEDDFDKYSKMGADIQNPTYEDANGWGYLFGWRPFADEVENKVTFARDNGEALFAERHSGSGNTGTPSVVDPIYRHLSEEEIAIYNYYLAKEGEEKADEYLESLEDKLNQREAGEEFSRYQGRTGLEIMYGITAGADQFKSGMKGVWKSLFSDDDYIPPSAIQYTGQAIREDLAAEEGGFTIFGSSIGQLGYDFLSTTTNMAPSILASYAVGMLNPVAGSVVGKGLLGASAAGNAYQDKLNLGYSKGEARTYGYLVGASEVLLESMLGGISAYGGSTLSNGSIRMLSQMDNVLGDFARTAGGKLLMNASSEALEEGIQAILEPYIWQAVSGEEASVDWQETLYSSLLGFLSGGLFEAAPAISTWSANANAKNTYRPVQGDLVNQAQQLDPRSKYVQTMKAKVDAGKNLSGVQLSHLAEIRNEGIRDNVRYGFEERLRENGETGDVYAISEALAKKSFGEELTRSEKRLIAKSEYAQSISQELDAAVESAQSEDVATEGITPEEYTGIVKDAEAVVNEADETESTAKVEDLKSEIASLQETVRNPDISAEEKAVATEQLEAARQELKTLES